MREVVSKIFDKLLFPPFKLLSIVEYPENFSMNSHAHDFIQLAFCVSGEMFFEAPEGKSISLKKGEMIVIPINNGHTCEAVKSGSKALQICLSPMLLENYGELSVIFGNKPRQSFKINVGKGNVDKLVKSLENEFDSSFPGSNVMAHALMLELLTLALRRNEENNEESPSENLAVRKAVNYIETHYRRKITLDELAQNSCLCPSRFSQIFKESTGYSPIEYANVFRIERAKALLSYSDMSIGEISDYLGFESVHYFNRAFKKRVKVPPGQFAGKK